MATTYRKNEHGFYVRPPHTLAVLYWLGLLFFSLFISLLATLTGLWHFGSFLGALVSGCCCGGVEDLRSRFTSP